MFASINPLLNKPVRSAQWKAVSCLLLALLFDFLFYQATGPSGWTPGLFTLGVLLAWSLHTPEGRKSRVSFTIFMLTVLLGVQLVIHPTITGILMVMVGLLTLTLTRFQKIRHVFQWLGEGALYLLLAAMRLIKDLAIWQKCRVRHRIRISLLMPAITLVLSVVFISMFSLANPVVEQWLNQLNWKILWAWLNPGRLFLMGGVILLSWTFVRPPICRFLRMRKPMGIELAGMPPFLGGRSFLLPLLVLNAIFLCQNGLDILFLWGGGVLPEGMTHAEYAHRGAYPLIFTALMAGGLALAIGQQTGQVARFLLYFWIGQNIFLTISAMQRTLLYIEEYSLTYLRVAALIWMGLVALGLIFILIKQMTHRRALWLLNANTLALVAVLYTCSFVNFGELIATYNVQHCREITGNGKVLDVWYLTDYMGPDALPALNWYIIHAPEGASRVRAKHGKTRLLTELDRQTADWRGWTLHRQYLKETYSAGAGNALELREQSGWRLENRRPGN